jgi:hypothetical protein
MSVTSILLETSFVSILTVVNLIFVEKVNDRVEVACPEEVTTMLSWNGFSTDIIETVSTIHSEPVTLICSEPVTSTRSASDIAKPWKCPYARGPLNEFITWMRSNEAVDFEGNRYRRKTLDLFAHPSCRKES